MKDGISLYLKKLSHYIKVDYEEIRPAKYGSGKVEQWRRQETEQLLKRLNSTELNIFLDEKGKCQTSKGLALWLEKQMPLGWPRVNFVIGGAYGFDKSLLADGVHYLSLSEMTFTHQMVRIILLEQLYRAFSIMRGEPYHHA
ncbi:MAG: 23S rRNA (pseudouridine(1915)-N(3))-methyltransferase RlmH [SAR324 cluster bacterium]|nr:23S rRNA (pseudouridine(1915)-N(3))-methyltransferase RlmH [SAR324 cluster bacterium]